VKKLGTIQLMTILLGASLLAACAQTAPLAPLANPNPSATTVSVPVTATTVSVPVTATTVAPVATSTPKSSSTSSIPLTAGNCTLLTKDDVSKVLAQAVEEVRDPVHNGSICEYQTKNLILVLAVANVPGVPGVQTMQRVLASLGGGVDVPGLGDEAFYSLLNSHAILSVRKGDSVYSFTLKGVSPADTLSLEDAQAKEKALAELLLSHLP
jgi:hypothetical protein